MRKPSRCLCRHPAIKELILTDQQFREVHCLFMEEIRKGLNRCSYDYADVKCSITYIQDTLTGKESGQFLALDWGGTSFRVLLLTFQDFNKDFNESKTFEIPEELLTGTREQLFDYIAECLAEFVTEQSLNEEELFMGFTFSFPYKQLGLVSGKLLEWTKGFECADVVEEDVVPLLQAAIGRREDVKITILAILKDVTGTLMCCSQKYPNCRISCIIGNDGMNACYMEKVINVEVYNGPREKPYLMINCEWGGFGDSGTLDFIRTDFDEDVDRNSVNPGKKIFEKMVSGMFLGEQVRLIIQMLVSQGILFQGKGSEKFCTRYTFPTKNIAEIESDQPGCYRNCRNVLLNMAITNATDQDCENVRYICELISKRAAFLSGTTMAVILNKMDEECVTIAIDGSLFRIHPFFERHMYQKTREMTCKKIKFNMFLTDDGSGLGAALVAAVVKPPEPIEETDQVNKKASSDPPEPPANVNAPK